MKDEKIPTRLQAVLRCPSLVPALLPPRPLGFGFRFGSTCSHPAFLLPKFYPRDSPWVRVWPPIGSLKSWVGRVRSGTTLSIVCSLHKACSESEIDLPILSTGLKYRVVGGVLGTPRLIMAWLLRRIIVLQQYKKIERYLDERLRRADEPSLKMNTMLSCLPLVFQERYVIF